MSKEGTDELVGKLWRNGVKIEDEGVIGEVLDRGYGEKKGKVLFLKPYEAMYLLDMGKLKIYGKKGEEIGRGDLVLRLKKWDKRGWTKYLIYRDLRSKGYVVKEGFGGGLDFRVYARGEYKKKPARYLIISLNEGGQMRVEFLKRLVDKAIYMGKEPILAVVDRRGEVVYYRAFKMGLNF
jgi:tRNA-intron endonuclease